MMKLSCFQSVLDFALDWRQPSRIQPVCDNGMI